MKIKKINLKFWKFKKKSLSPKVPDHLTVIQTVVKGKEEIADT